VVSTFETNTYSDSGHPKKFFLILPDRPNGPQIPRQISRNKARSKRRGLLFGRNRSGGFVYLAVLGVPALREPPSDDAWEGREGGEKDES